jgi:hypothetical protein
MMTEANSKGPAQTHPNNSTVTNCSNFLEAKSTGGSLVFLDSVKCYYTDGQVRENRAEHIFVFGSLWFKESETLENCGVVVIAEFILSLTSWKFEAKKYGPSVATKKRAKTRLSPRSSEFRKK